MSDSATHKPGLPTGAAVEPTDGEPQGLSSEAAAAMRSGGREPAGDVLKETPVWTGRTHWKHFLPGMVLWALGMVVVSWLLLKAFASQESASWVGWFLTILWLGSALVVFGRIFVKILGHRYRLTTQRLFIERGILSQTIDQIELLRVDDVRMHRTILDRMFGLGIVEVMSTDATTPKVQMVGIAAPETVAEHIRSHMRLLRNKKAVFVESL